MTGRTGVLVQAIDECYGQAVASAPTVVIFQECDTLGSKVLTADAVTKSFTQ